MYFVHSHFMRAVICGAAIPAHTVFLGLRNRAGLSGALSLGEMQGREAGKSTATADERVPHALDLRKNRYAFETLSKMEFSLSE